MRVKKGFGRVYGVSMTTAEQKAMRLEIGRQIAEYERQHAIDLEATVLWVLHEEFGFGEKRLHRFHDMFVPLTQKLLKQYDMNEDDQSWLCRHKLKELGLDISKWSNENK